MGTTQHRPHAGLYGIFLEHADYPYAPIERTFSQGFAIALARGVRKHNPNVLVADMVHGDIVFGSWKPETKETVLP